MVTLDNTVRLVMLQVRFSKKEYIPNAIQGLRRETEEERVKRSGPTNGIQVIEPTKQTSLQNFLEEFEALDYELVSAYAEKRTDTNDASDKRDSYEPKYYIVRFVFVRREFAQTSEAFKAVRSDVRAALQEICETAFWRVRAYSNPFFENGEEVSGQRAVSINLEGRQPLLQSDGQPVMARIKVDGKAEGDPVPLRPMNTLSVVDNTLLLLPVHYEKR